MAKRMWGACLALGMGWAAASGPVSLAKPPDLPVDPQVTCPEGREAGGKYVEPSGPADVGVTPIPDLAWTDVIGPMIVQKTLEAGWLWPVGGHGPNTVYRSPEELAREAALEKYRQAQRLFQTGLQYEQTGQLAKARTCYQEAHLVSPNMRFGRLAMDRLSAIDRRHSGVEEAEQPDKPAGSGDFLDMLRGTMPLGAVPVEKW